MEEIKNTKPQTTEPSPEANGNVFTNLFEEGEKKTNGPSDVVDSVVKKASTNGSILGPKPKTDNVNIVEKPISFGRSFLKLVVFLWVVLLAGSYLTMGASYNVGGLNEAIESEQSIEDTTDLQAEFNANNYLVAYYYLDSFAYMADSYLYKYAQYESQYTSSNTKESLEDDITELESDMTIALELAQERLAHDLAPDGIEVESDISTELFFKQATIDLFEDKILDLESKGSDPDLLTEIDGLQGALGLLRNGAFVKEIVATNTDDGLAQDTVSTISSGVSEITEDDFSIIASIKADRDEWSEIIQKIEEITKDVDPLYGTSVESDLVYTSYSLNSRDNSVSLQGRTTTDDSRNFTLIVNLIDAFEESSMFMNVTERTFTKNDSSEDGVEAKFRIEFELQDGEDYRDAKFTLEEEDTSEPVSRTATS